MTHVTDETRQKRTKQERAWLSEMERLGPEMVRMRLIDRRPVTSRPPYPEPAFVEKWLIRKTRRSNLRADLLAAIMIIAMIAACIAAWPVARGWIDTLGLSRVPEHNTPLPPPSEEPPQSPGTQ
jgi:hypothetical protein